MIFFYIVGAGLFFLAGNWFTQWNNDRFLNFDKPHKWYDKFLLDEELRKRFKK